MRDTPKTRKPVILIIMDGYGIRQENHGNAINQAKKPHLDRFFGEYPYTTIQASGGFVGLPDGQMGNSEVGHLNMGAGRVIYQPLTLISKAIDDGTFFTNEHYLKAMERVKEKGGKLHIFALTSDGGVHAHMKHIIAIIKMAKMHGLSSDQLCYHAFLDGRDVAPQSSAKYLDEIQKTMDSEGIGHITSLGGRYWGMDRDKNLDRVDKDYRVLTMREGNSFTDYHEYIQSEYARLAKEGKSASDEFVLPAYDSRYDGKLEDGDSVIFMNFRPDRAIQMSTLITCPDFYEHPLKNADGSFAWKPYTPPVILKDIFFVCTMHYADYVKGEIAFAIPEVINGLGPVLAERGLKQLRIAETEKYAHVTFYFDGEVDYDDIHKPALKGCRRVLIPSPKVATYDLLPEMSAYKILDALLKELDKKDLDVVILNFANCDMVGHTAIMPAVIKAVETVDECVGKILDYCDKNGGTVLVTADHGNADECLTDEGKPMTQHTTNPVPFCINDKSFKMKEGCALCDIAPTILYLLGEKQPQEMTGHPIVFRPEEKENN
ncbi:MAG: 2,3-bisphosphoglycerate-independent phosphoglycerate mutase [Bacilli bacterium]|jgi:2,3-bisphosphoglycerate-independent phosphoglycerate mutase|nr:2,3-bisphosphoglycerate-independent phosphoglycerate mutase [Bacilli bacterium]